MLRKNLLFLWFLLFLLPACSQETEPVVQYTTPKPETVFAENHVPGAQPPPREGRRAAEKKRTPANGPAEQLWGLMVIDGPTTWFFKYQGPADQIEGDKFAELAGSVHFAGGKPVWKTPTGWRTLPEDDPRNRRSDVRFGTVLTGSATDAPEVSVTKFPTREPLENYILQNVNRWCNQLGVPPRTKENLYTSLTEKQREEDRFVEVVKRKIDGRQAVLVHMKGYRQARRGPPFFGR